MEGKNLIYNMLEILKNTKEQSSFFIFVSQPLVRGVKSVRTKSQFCTKGNFDGTNYGAFSCLLPLPCNMMKVVIMIKLCVQNFSFFLSINQAIP